MKVFIIGGTGLLGAAGAAELIARGHEVTSIALPPVPEGAGIPKEMQLYLGDYLKITDSEFLEQMAGCEGFVFAAGVDERIEYAPPVYDAYVKYNIEPVKRLLRLARQAGVKRCVILGSYFCHFAKAWPHMELEKHHPYIRGRMEQERAALSFSDKEMDVMVLQLPYIFGAQPGRKPVWVFLVKQLRAMKAFPMYPRGGTAMVTVRQVGQCIAGALERGKGGTCYPVGWYDMPWKELLNIIYAAMGMPGKRVLTIPTWLFRLSARSIMNDYARRGVESGLDMVAYSAFMTAYSYIDKAIIRDQLGVGEDDITDAIRQSVLLCLDVLDGRVQAVGMKAE